MKTDNHYRGIGPLFDRVKQTLANKAFLTEVVDICARKHKGNEQSTAAFHVIKETLTLKQTQVLQTIRSYDHRGLTVDELSMMLRTNPNAISGRVSELKAMGKIYKSGTRKTRSGCSAAILKAFS